MPGVTTRAPRAGHVGPAVRGSWRLATELVNQPERTGVCLAAVLQTSARSRRFACLAGRIAGIADTRDDGCKRGHRHNNPRPTGRWFDPANTKRRRGNRPEARNALRLDPERSGGLPRRIASPAMIAPKRQAAPGFAPAIPLSAAVPHPKSPSSAAPAAISKSTDLHLRNNRAEKRGDRT